MNFIDVMEDSLDAEFCEDVIRRFEADDRKFQGHVQSYSGEIEVHADYKSCTELNITEHPEWADVQATLMATCTYHINTLREQYHGLNYFRTAAADRFRVKKYLPGKDFFRPHIDLANFDQAHRYHVMIWYLNSVDEGGETYFVTQDIAVKPEQGRLLMFPPYWTHEHEGLTPVSGPKYIITSWVLMDRR